MTSPVRAIRFIHQAILSEVGAFEDAAWGGSLDGWPERAERLRRIVELHTLGEEVSIFADLHARLPESAATYLFDHVEEQRLFEEAIAAARAGDVEHTRRLASALAAHVRAHVRKEEELVVPLLERTFSMAELGGQVGRMMGAFPPAELMAALPWIVERLSADDRIAYCAMLAKVAPPERVGAMGAAIRGGVAADVWTPIAAAVPAMA